MQVRLTMLLLACVVLAACTRITTQAGGPNTAANPWTAHGVLRIGGVDVPDNLNRMLGTLTVDAELSHFWCAHLLIFDDHETMLPELALQEPTLANKGISADGRTIVYHLRHGVNWHDGKPFTAADVIFSWQQVMNPNNLVQSRTNYDRVENIIAPDPYTVVVHMKQPDAPFISDFFTNYCLIPKHILDGLTSINHADYNRLPIGTGAFKVAVNEPGVLVKLVANTQYWRGAPKLREVDYRIIPNETTLLTEIRSHEIDFYHLASAEQTPQFGSIPGTAVYRYPFSRFNDLGFNIAHTAVSDKRVRQALMYAIDVPKIIRVATHGVFLRADSDQPPWRWAHPDGLKHYDYQPSAAAELLDAAGWRLGANNLRYKNGQPLELLMVGVVGSPTQNAAQLVMQQEWRAAGIDVTMKNFPNNVLYALGSGVEQSGKFDIIYEGWTESGDPDQLQLYGCAMAPPAGWNVYHYCNPSVDRAEAIALRNYDRDVRKRAYAVIEQANAEELPFSVLWFVQNQDLVNSDLHGFRPGKTNSTFWNVWEWSI
ncbi:MAG: peptide ABC transporter substrate-binding protein [Candidatus Eremiobacteraeota bacterium]|nr:peptide ABC transporter substrate-binding protein [Candidatus Eremiobacteraeota bacterium]